MEMPVGVWAARRTLLSHGTYSRDLCAALLKAAEYKSRFKKELSHVTEVGMGACVLRAVRMGACALRAFTGERSVADAKLC
jgi:hypothetical protein